MRTQDDDTTADDGGGEGDPLSLLLREADARRGEAARRKLAGASTATADTLPDGGPTEDEIQDALALLIRRVEDASRAETSPPAPGAWKSGLKEVARRMKCPEETVLAHLSGHGADGRGAWALLELILEAGLAAEGREEWLETVGGDGRNGRPMTSEEAGINTSYTAEAAGAAEASGADEPGVEGRRRAGGHWWQR